MEAKKWQVVNIAEKVRHYLSCFFVLGAGRRVRVVRNGGTGVGDMKICD